MELGQFFLTAIVYHYPHNFELFFTLNILHTLPGRVQSSIFRIHFSSFPQSGGLVPQTTTCNTGYYFYYVAGMLRLGFCHGKFHWPADFCLSVSMSFTSCKFSASEIKKYASKCIKCLYLCWINQSAQLTVLARGSVFLHEKTEVPISKKQW